VDAHDIGYVINSESIVLTDANTVNIHTILIPQTPTIDVNMGVMLEPIPRITPAKTSEIPHSE